MARTRRSSNSPSFNRFHHDRFDDKLATKESQKQVCCYRRHCHCRAKESPGCCGRFCNALKFIGIVIGQACYVICPPVPETVTRKIAFYPPPKGLSYRLVTYDSAGKVVDFGNAAKADRHMVVELEINRLWEGPMMLTDRIETFFVRTSAGSVLTVVHARKRHRARGKWGVEQVVIFSQPNGSDLGFFLQPMAYRSHPCNLRFLADKLHVDVYMYDYSGYGMSSGHASEENIYCDLDAVYRHVLDTRGPDIRIVLLGYSMGTAATVRVASRNPPNLCGVILIAPFTSGLRLLFNKASKEDTCCLDRFVSYDRAPDVVVPTLICHGLKDDVVPVEHGMTLHTRFPRAVKPLYLPEADHLNIFTCKFVSVVYRAYLFLHYECDPLRPS